MWDGGTVVDRLILDTTDFIRKVDESAKRLRDLTSQSQISLKLDKSFQRVTEKLGLLKTQLGELSTTKYLKIDAETSKVQQEVKRLYDSLVKVSAASKMAAADLSHLGNVNIKGPYDLVEKYYAAARRMKQRVPVPQAEEDLAVKYFKSLTPKEGAAIAEWVPGAFDKSTSAVKAFLATQEQANASVARAVSIVEPYVAGIRNAGNALERAAALNEGFKTSTAHIVKALEMMNAALESQRNAYIRTAEAAARYRAGASATATITTPQITPAGGMAQLPAIADWMTFLPSRKHIDAALDQSVIESRKAAEKYQQFVRTLVPKGGAAATGAIADWITFLPSNKHIEAALDQSVIASKKAYERYQQFMRTLIPVGKMAEQPAIADWITFLPSRTYIERALDQSVIASKKAAERYQQFVRSLIPVGRMVEQPAIADWITFLPSQRHIEQALDRSIIASRQAYVKYQAFLASLVPVTSPTIAAQTAVPFVNFQASTKHIQSFIRGTEYARRSASDTAVVIGASWNANVNASISRSIPILQRFAAAVRRNAVGSQAGFVNMGGMASMLSSGFGAVEKVIGGIGRGIKNAAGFTLGWYWSAAKIAVPFWAAYRTINLIELGIKTIAGELWNALAVAEKFKVQALSISAIIASLSKNDDTAKAFKSALAYAEILGAKLDIIAAKYMATGAEVQLVWLGFIREGLVPTTQIAVEAMAEVTDMIKSLTGEQQFAQQGLQEVAGLVKGIADNRSRLYMLVSKANPLFKKELEILRQEAAVTGDYTKAFQYIRDQIKGAGVASGYFANTWTGLKDTLRSILNVIERMAIAPVYGKLTGILITLRDQLMTSGGELTAWAIDLANSLSQVWQLMLYALNVAISLTNTLLQQTGGVKTNLITISTLLYWSQQTMTLIWALLATFANAVTVTFYGLVSTAHRLFAVIAHGASLVIKTIPFVDNIVGDSLDRLTDYLYDTANTYLKATTNTTETMINQGQIMVKSWNAATKKYDAFIEAINKPLVVDTPETRMAKEFEKQTELANRLDAIRSSGSKTALEQTRALMLSTTGTLEDFVIATETSWDKVKRLAQAFLPLKTGAGAADATKKAKDLETQYAALISLQQQYQQELNIEAGMKKYLADLSNDQSTMAIAAEQERLQLTEKIRTASERASKEKDVTTEKVNDLKAILYSLAAQIGSIKPGNEAIKKLFGTAEDWDLQAKVSEHMLEQWKLMPDMSRDVASAIANVTYGFKKYGDNALIAAFSLEKLLEAYTKSKKLQDQIDMFEQTEQLRVQILLENTLTAAISRGVIEKERDASVLRDLMGVFEKYRTLGDEQIQIYVELATKLADVKEANSRALESQGQSLRAFLDEIINEKRQFVDQLKGIASDIERYFSDVIFDVLEGVELKFKDFFKSLKSMFHRAIADILASKMKAKLAEYVKSFLPEEKTSPELGIKSMLGEFLVGLKQLTSDMKAQAAGSISEKKSEVVAPELNIPGVPIVEYNIPDLMEYNMPDISSKIPGIEAAISGADVKILNVKTAVTNIESGMLNMGSGGFNPSNVGVNIPGTEQSPVSDVFGILKNFDDFAKNLGIGGDKLEFAASKQLDAAAIAEDAAVANIKASKIEVATSYEQVGILTRMKNWLSSTFGGGGGATSPAMAGGNIGGGGGGGGLFSFLSGGSGSGFGGSLASLAQTILPLYAGGSIGSALGGMLSNKGLPGGSKVGMAAGLLSAMALGYAPAVGSLIGFGAGSAAAGAAGATGAFGAAGGTAMAGMSYLGPLGLAGSLGYLGGGYLSNAIWESPGATKWGGIGGAAGGVGGALLGMKFGASLGSIVPGLGTIIGAIIGALIGALLGGFLGDNKDELDRLYGKKSTLGMAKGIKQLAGYSYKTEGEFPEEIPGTKRFGVTPQVTLATEQDWKKGGWKYQIETFINRAVTKINFLGKEFTFRYRHYSWTPGLDEKEIKRFDEWMKTMLERLKELVQEVGQALSQALTTSFEGTDVQTGWKTFVETTHASFAKMISDALAGSFATSRLALEVTMPLREAIESALVMATTVSGVFSPEMFEEMVAPAVERYRGELENLLPVYEEIYNINKRLTDELTKKEELKEAVVATNNLNLTVSILGTGDQRQVAAELADTFLGELKRRGITVVNA